METGVELEPDWTQRSIDLESKPVLGESDLSSGAREPQKREDEEAEQGAGEPEGRGLEPVEGFEQRAGALVFRD
jgi:hypothetical protein